MKILVTGANGQLGRELRGVLESQRPGITVYTDVDDLDLTDAKAVENFIAGNDLSHIINCAAYTAVDRAEEEKLQCAKVNVDAVRNIARAANEWGVRVLHISTDYVFDGTACRPYRESDKVNPVSQYGTTKRQGETALLALAPDSIIIRTAWLYSPFGHNFVKTILSKIKQKQPLKVVADQIGTPTYALDLAHAIFKIITAAQWVEGIYHFTDSGVASWFDFAKAIAEISNHPHADIQAIPTDDYPTPATRPHYSVLDSSIIRATYGVKTPYWRDSLAECIARINSNIQ